MLVSHNIKCAYGCMAMSVSWNRHCHCHRHSSPCYNYSYYSFKYIPSFGTGLPWDNMQVWKGWDVSKPMSSLLDWLLNGSQRNLVYTFHMGPQIIPVSIEVKDARSRSWIFLLLFSTIFYVRKMWFFTKANIPYGT